METAVLENVDVVVVVVVMVVVVMVVVVVVVVVVRGAWSCRWRTKVRWWNKHHVILWQQQQQRSHWQRRSGLIPNPMPLPGLDPALGACEAVAERNMCARVAEKKRKKKKEKKVTKKRDGGKRGNKRK